MKKKENMEHFMVSKRNSCFISENNIKNFCFENYNIDLKVEDLNFLIKNNFLPYYEHQTEKYFLEEDIRFVIPIVKSLQHSFEKENLLYELFYDRNSLSITDSICSNKLVIRLEDLSEHKSFIPTIRNLLKQFTDSESISEETLTSFPLFSHSKLTTKSKRIIEFLDGIIKRQNVLKRENSSHFANSAYYMGSKKNLSSFLVEAFSGFIDESAIVVDLMCGSGAASGSFSNFWKTISSDSQTFSQKLALIQGGGFDLKKVKELTDKIIKSARIHASDLMYKLEYFVQVEENFFHKNVNYELMEKYKKFIGTFPTYPDNSQLNSWAPLVEINERKKNNMKYPFCLFTGYFANIYFGLRQCIEIDSVRYAIEEIEDNEGKDWALGALIATTSSLASNFGGHFAQPIKINENNFAKILESRSQSIFHEFSIRFLNLAIESEKKLHKVELMPGPFLQTLKNLEKKNFADNDVMIYVDAPYKRDEYSRYYHLLETLVLYNYPSSIGNGRVPKKGEGERFASEFFTRNYNNLNEIFINLFSRILQNGWKCAWSYSNNGDANMKYIIENVYKRMNCKVISYSVQYQHMSQGGRKAKKVKEFLIIFEKE